LPQRPNDSDYSQEDRKIGRAGEEILGFEPKGSLRSRNDNAQELRDATPKPSDLPIFL
jgi:hypothetical protein